MEQLKLPKKLTLDVSKWRSGGASVNMIGDGCTLLLNKEGYMCCLGQFCLQAGCTKEEVLERLGPRSLNFPVVGLSYKNRKRVEVTNFANVAMQINDSSFTVSSRISRLRKLCQEYGYELEVINWE